MILAGHWAPIVIAVISGAGTVLVTIMKIKGDKSASIPEAYQGLVQEMKIMDQYTVGAAGSRD